MACSPETFVRVWQTTQSIAEAASTLGMREDAARSRAASYRRRGIPLKSYATERLVVTTLAALARELDPDGGRP